MDVIGFHGKTRPMEGRIEHYWFENPHIGLQRTQFHRIVIPFEPFDSGLEDVSQPESTELVVDWINLALADPGELDGIVIAMGANSDVEASIYLGASHNGTDIKELRFDRVRDAYRVQCRAIIEFETEGVAPNEPLEFEALVRYAGEA